MRGKLAMTLVILLSVLAVAGITGMLLVDSRMGRLFFSLAMLPLFAGAGCLLWMRNRKR